MTAIAGGVSSTRTSSHPAVSADPDLPQAHDPGVGPDTAQYRASGTDPDPAQDYALGAGPGESARLRRQSEELRPEAEALLAGIGLEPGQAAIDLGCGPAGI